MLEKIGRIDVANPEQVAVFLDKKIKSIVIVGEHKAVEQLSKQVMDIAVKLEEELEEENQLVTKVLQLKHYELSLVRASRLEQQIKKDGVDIQIKGDTREIVLQVINVSSEVLPKVAVILS